MQRKEEGKMKHQIISKGLYVEGLRKIKIPSIIFLALVALTQLAVPLFSALEMLFDGFQSATVVGPSEIMNVAMLIPFLYTPILGLVEFFSFNKRGSSDYYLSLSYTRTCIYFSWALSVFTISAALIIIAGLMGYGAMALFPSLYILQINGLADVLLSFLAAAVFAISAVLIAVSITGTFISNLASMLAVMFLPRLILVLIREIIVNMSQLADTNFFAQWLGIYYNQYSGGIVTFFLGLLSPSKTWQGDIGPDVYTLLLALAQVALGALLFKIRRSETAGRSSSSRMVQHIVRVAITLAISLLGTMFIVEGVSEVAGVIIYLLAVIAFFAYEIITTKKWKNLLKALPSLAIVVGLNIAVWLVAVIISKALIYQNISADSIRAVRVIRAESFSSSFISPTFEGEDYFCQLSADVELKDREAVETVAQALKTDQENIRNNSYDIPWSSAGNGPGRTPMTFGLKTGSGYTYRKITLSDEQLLTIDSCLTRSEDFREKYMTLPEPVPESFVVVPDRMGNLSMLYGNLDRSSIKEIMDSLQTEIDNMGFDAWYEYKNGDAAYSTVLVRYSENSAESQMIYVPVNPELFPQTFRMIMRLATKYCVETAGSREGLKLAMDNLDDLIHHKNESWIMANVTICSEDDAGNIGWGQYFDVLTEGVFWEVGEKQYGPEDFEKLINDGLNSNELPAENSFVFVEYSGCLPDGEFREGNVLLPLCGDKAK